MNLLRWLIIVFTVVVGIVIFVRLRAPCDCHVLEFDQHDGVGTFVSFSRDPLSRARDPEIAPARIRARGGELITWVLRNPSNNDITVGLHSVVEPGSSVNLRDKLFQELDRPVTIRKGCRIAPLQGRLVRNILTREKQPADCDSSLVFNYFFMIHVLTGVTGKGDSMVCAWPYDPELVVERDP